MVTLSDVLNESTKGRRRNNRRKRKRPQLHRSPTRRATKLQPGVDFQEKIVSQRQLLDEKERTEEEHNDGRKSLPSFHADDDHSENELPYAMHFSQPSWQTVTKKAGDESSDDDEIDTGYESPGKQRLLRNREPLRPGDVIAYQDTSIYKAGGELGRTVATVMACRTNTNFPLVLSTGDRLLPEVHVKRTHEYKKGELMKHHGRYRKISEFDIIPGRLPSNLQSSDGWADVWNQACRHLETKAVEFLRGDHETPSSIQDDQKRFKSTKDSPAKSLKKSNWKEKHEILSHLLPSNVKPSEHPNESDTDDVSLESSTSEDSTDSSCAASPAKVVLRTQPLKCPPQEDGYNTEEELRKIRLGSDKYLANSSKSKGATRISKQRTSYAVPMTTVASKIEEAKRVQRFLDASSTDDDDDSIVGRGRIFPQKYSSCEAAVGLSKPTTGTVDGMRQKNYSTRLDDRSTTSSTSKSTIVVGRDSIRHQRLKNLDRRTIKPWSQDESTTTGQSALSRRPPVASEVASKKKFTELDDLFEDSSSSDSNTKNYYRRRNRRGNNVLFSRSRRPMFGQDVRSDSRRNSGRLGLPPSSPLYVERSGRQPNSKKSKHKISNGYEPLSIFISNSNGSPKDDEKSPPSLTKVYEKRRKQKEILGATRVCTSSEQGTGVNSKQKRIRKGPEKSDIPNRGHNNRPPRHSRTKVTYEDEVVSTQERELSDSEIDSQEESVKARRTVQCMASICYRKPSGSHRNERFHRKVDSKHSKSALTTKGPLKKINMPDLDEDHGLFSSSSEKLMERQSNYSTPRYTLSSSSSEDGNKKQRPGRQTPWSTDCEIESPQTSSAGHAYERKQKRGKTMPTIQKKIQRRRDIFDFSSHDENEERETFAVTSKMLVAGPNRLAKRR